MRGCTGDCGRACSVGAGGARTGDCDAAAAGKFTGAGCRGRDMDPVAGESTGAGCGGREVELAAEFWCVAAGLGGVGECSIGGGRWSSCGSLGGVAGDGVLGVE